MSRRRRESVLRVVLRNGLRYYNDVGHSTDDDSQTRNNFMANDSRHCKHELPSY